jgi:hypothetical protein
MEANGACGCLVLGGWNLSGGWMLEFGGSVSNRFRLFKIIISGLLEREWQRLPDCAHSSP